MELWSTTVSSPRHSAEFAAEAERFGWHGMLVVDSQNLSGDPYVSLAMAATATSRLGLGTGVTNPVTRHPAVTATAILSIQKVSDGRAVLGIGRGDSALAHLGRAPARVGWFEQYLENLQAYLNGQDVDFAKTGVSSEIAPEVANLELADAPRSSKIAWIGNTPKVPVEVAATGPKVIAAAARHADRVMFAVGADPKRLAWGIATAREAAAAAGRPAPDFGAYVTVVCHDDVELGRRLGRAGTGLFARFSVMHGTIAGPVDEKQAEVFHNIHDRYDMNAHGQQGGRQTTALTDDFVDEFSIIGPAQHCIERLQALAELGITKFAIGGPTFAARSAEAQAAAHQFAERVLPALG
jgi:5,10-methylenetetrahydromethanopterin reductase